MSSKYPLPRKDSSGVSQSSTSSLWVRNKQRNSLFVGAQSGGFGHSASNKTSRNKTYNKSKSNKKRLKEGIFNFWNKGTTTTNKDLHLNDVDSRGLPLVIKVASRYIERCLTTEGIYRVSGNKTRVQSFYDLFRNGNGATIRFAHADVHAWTGLLKQFLRDQVEPLLTFPLFNSFIDIANIKEKENEQQMKLHYFTVILSNLPVENKACVAHLMLHLYDVASHSNENKMNYKNLGVVFGPTLLRPKKETMEYLKQVPLGNSVISSMIELAPLLFGDYLEQQLKRNKDRRRRHHPPHIITSVIEYLEASRLLNTDGLYRVSGSKTTINDLKSMCMRGEKGLSGRFVSMQLPHVATGLLKQYLRELPEPLIPFNSYHEFVSTARVASNGLEQIMKENKDGSNLDNEKMKLADGLHDAVTALPELNRRTLRLLVRHLHRVALLSSANRMNTENLGVVFGPTCLRPEHETPEQMMSGDDKMVMKTLIELSQYIYPSNEDSDNEDTGLTQAEPEALLPEHGDKRAFKHATLYNNERFTTNGLRNLSLYSSDEDGEEIVYQQRGDEEEDDETERDRLPLPLPGLPPREQRTISGRNGQKMAPPHSAPPTFQESEDMVEEKNGKNGKDKEIMQLNQKVLALENREKQLETVIEKMKSDYNLLEEENQKLIDLNIKYKISEDFRKEMVKGTKLPPGMMSSIKRSELGISSDDNIIEEEEDEEDETDEEEDDDDEDGYVQQEIQILRLVEEETEENVKESNEDQKSEQFNFGNLLDEKSSFGNLLGGVLGGIMDSPEKEEKNIAMDKNVKNEKKNDNKDDDKDEEDDEDTTDSDEEEEVAHRHRGLSSPPMPSSMKLALGVTPLLGGRTSRSKSEIETEFAMDARTDDVMVPKNVTSTPRHRVAPPVPTKKRSKKPPPPIVPKKPANINDSLRKRSSSSAMSTRPPPPGQRSRSKSNSKKPKGRAAPPAPPKL